MTQNAEEIIKELRAGPLSGNPVFEDAADMLEALQARAEAAEEQLRHFGELHAAEYKVMEARAEAAEKDAAGLREVLQWYADKVRDCRKMHKEGEDARHALDADGGNRARAALEAKP